MREREWVFVSVYVCGRDRRTSALLAAHTFFRVGLISSFGDLRIGFTSTDEEEATEGERGTERRLYEVCMCV